MKRRSFVKKSISASILTPLAFSGLIYAAGATGGGTGDTSWPETTGWFGTETTLITNFGTMPNRRDCVLQAPEDPSDVVYKWIYLDGFCYKLWRVDPTSPGIGNLPLEDRFDQWCVVGYIKCDSNSRNGDTLNPPNCANLKSEFQNPDGTDMLGPGVLTAQWCYASIIFLV